MCRCSRRGQWDGKGVYVCVGDNVMVGWMGRVFVYMCVFHVWVGGIVRVFVCVGDHVGVSGMGRVFVCVGVHVGVMGWVGCLCV